MISRSIALALLLYAFINSAAGQDRCNIRITGVIKDEHKDEPLSFANISIRDSSIGTVSDSAGRYILDGLCPGELTLVCHHIGCIEVMIKVNLRSDTIINFFPEHHAHQLKTISITETSNHKHTQTVTNSSWRNGNMSFAEILKVLPGITSLSTGSTISKPAIQGLYGSRVSIIQDGVKLEGQSWGQEHAPEISAASAGDIEVVKGGGALKYSHENLGGAIVIKPKVLRSTPGISGDISTGYNSNGHGSFNSFHVEKVSGKFKGLGFALQGSFNKQGNISTPSITLENTGSESRSISWRVKKITDKRKHEVSYSLLSTNNGIFEGSHFENLTDLKNIIEGKVSPEDAEFTYAINAPSQTVLHEVFKYEGSEKIKDETVYLNASRQYDRRQEFGEEAGLDEPEIQFELTTFQFITGLVHEWKKDMTTDVGVNLKSMKNTWDHEFFIPNYLEQGIGAYLIQKARVKDIPIEAAIRYDSKKRNVYLSDSTIVLEKYDYSGFSGALSGHKSVMINTDMYFSVTSAWRAPTVNEQFTDGIHHGNAAFEKGNRSLKREQSFNIEGGIEKTEGKLTADVSMYLNQISNFMYLRPERTYTLTTRGAYPIYRYDQKDIIIKGIDGMLSFDPVKQISLVEKFSYLHAEIKDAGYIPGFPPAQTTTEINFLPETRLKRIHDLSFMTSAQYVFTQKLTNLRQELTPPPPGYFLLNAGIGGDIEFGSIHIDFYLQVTNILNTAYRAYTDRFRYFSDAPGRNIIASIKIPFDIQ